MRTLGWPDAPRCGDFRGYPAGTDGREGKSSSGRGEKLQAGTEGSTLRRRPAAGGAVSANAHQGLAACLWQHRERHREQDPRPRAHLCHRRRAASGKAAPPPPPGDRAAETFPALPRKHGPAPSPGRYFGAAPCPPAPHHLPARREGGRARPLPAGRGRKEGDGRAGVTERGGNVPREGREHPAPSSTALPAGERGPPVSAFRAGRDRAAGLFIAVSGRAEGRAAGPCRGTGSKRGRAVRTTWTE